MSTYSQLYNAGPSFYPSAGPATVVSNGGPYVSQTAPVSGYYQAPAAVPVATEVVQPAYNTVVAAPAPVQEHIRQEIPVSGLFSLSLLPISLL